MSDEYDLMDTKLVSFLSPEEKRQFVERHFAVGDPTKALAEVTGRPMSRELKLEAMALLDEDEFVKGLISQVTQIVSNDLVQQKAESASILADLRERSMTQGKPNAAVMAEVARGKVLGLYIDPKERSAEVMKLLAVDTMSEDELGQIIVEMQKLPSSVRKELALMIYNPELEVIEGEARVV